MKVAGIDVSAKTVTMVIRQQERAGEPRGFDNTPQGHAALRKVLRKASVTRICLEATGLYHLDLAIALDDAGLPVMVVNPKAAKRFAEARSSRTRTNAVDAALLSEFAQRMPFQPWARPDDQALGIRACARHIATLNQTCTQTKSQLHAAQQTAVTPDFVLANLQQSVEWFEAQIESFRQQVRSLIAADAHHQETFDLLVTVTGIATATAIQLLGELLVMPQDMKAKQWVAMAGLDPREHPSGSSVRKKPRLSKTGNRYLRLALYRPALNAARHNPHVRGYYHHLIENRGLKKSQAVCAVMRKLLHAIHAMLKTRTPFESHRFYALPEATA